MLEFRAEGEKDSTDEGDRNAEGLHGRQRDEFNFHLIRVLACRPSRRTPRARSTKFLRND
ncbi:hypothetical protein GCM10009563_11150 [Subtercola frigoramans]